MTAPSGQEQEECIEFQVPADLAGRVWGFPAALRETPGMPGVGGEIEACLSAGFEAASMAVFKLYLCMTGIHVQGPT